MGRFIGVDLHKNMFMVSFFEPRTGKHAVTNYHIRDIVSFVNRLNCDDTVGVESTNNTRYFVNQIRDCVKAVKVINPSQFKVISKSVKKTDWNDARVIAEFLSKPTLMMTALWIFMTLLNRWMNGCRVCRANS